MHIVEWLAHISAEGLFVAAVLAIWFPAVAGTVAVLSLSCGVVGAGLWIGNFRGARESKDRPD